MAVFSLCGDAPLSMTIHSQDHPKEDAFQHLQTGIPIPLKGMVMAIAMLHKWRLLCTKIAFSCNLFG
jgi:hypothetical protein